MVEIHDSLGNDKGSTHHGNSTGNQPNAEAPDRTLKTE